MFYWLIKRIVLGPILFAVFRPWVRGAENVPETGGVVLASNHLSFSDSIFLPLVLRRRVTFLAKADYFTGRGVKGRSIAAFFRMAGQVPLDRSGGNASEAALSTGLRVLRGGGVLGIYPEGTRSPDGRLYRGKTGAARMAIEAGVLVVPVAMIGTDKVQPIGQVIPNVGRVGIRFGTPLDFSRFKDRSEDHEALREATDEIMEALTVLSGQEYVDVYATTMKERLAAAGRSAANAASALGAAAGERAGALTAAAAAAGEKVKNAAADRHRKTAEPATVETTAAETTAVEPAAETAASEPADEAASMASVTDAASVDPVEDASVSAPGADGERLG